MLPASAPPPARVTHLLYLHGFRSSPRSMKAQKMAAVVGQMHPEVQFWCPQLPPSPAEAMALLREGTARWPRDGVGLMGSSLGGYYATWVAEHLHTNAHGPVVLINPAVDPATDLARHIGENTHWHDPQTSFHFGQAHVEELCALRCGPLAHPGRYQVWMATADEVLDWRQMHTRYAACAAAPSPAGLQVVQGSDHALSDFDDHLGAMLAHLRLA